MTLYIYLNECNAKMFVIIQKIPRQKRRQPIPTFSNQNAANNVKAENNSCIRNN